MSILTRCRTVKGTRGAEEVWHEQSGSLWRFSGGGSWRSAAIRLGLAQLHAKHANAYLLLPPLDTKPCSSSRPATRPLLCSVRRVRSST